MRTEVSAALHARLADLISDIGTHKEVPETLLRARSAIQRQLNDLHDPMARLPLEVSSDVFIHCIPPPDVYTEPSGFLVLLSICTAWTDIALSTSRLWTNLAFRIPLNVTTEFRDVFAEWLRRAKAHPFSLLLRGSAVADAGILDILAAHAHQLEFLELPSPSYLPLFGSGIVCLSLTLLDVDMSSPGRLEVHELIQVFRAAPNLEHCALSVGRRWPTQASYPHGVCHAHLKEFTIEGEGDPSDLLRVLTFPALEYLNIAVRDGDPQELISFLARSSPPLNTLVLDADNLIFNDSDRSAGTYHDDAVEQCFMLIPRLTRLEMTGWPELQHTVITLLTRPECETFLPNLAELDLTRDTWGFPDKELYKQLTAMLLRRCGTLRSFRLDINEELWQFHHPQKLDKDDERVFRALKADGMEVDLRGIKWSPEIGTVG